MTAFVLLIGLLLNTPPAARASEPESLLDGDVIRSAALQETNRVLAEEIKLAMRPQTYLLIDLTANLILLKGRGVEFYRIPITAWAADLREQMGSAFRLAARPPVARRRIDPSAPAVQDPISLNDMPTSYHLKFLPDLTIEVLPPAGDDPLRWVIWQTASWWRWVNRWATSVWSNQQRQGEPRLQLTLSDDQAQSLAWSLVDGMALVIRRPTDK